MLLILLLSCLAAMGVLLLGLTDDAWTAMIWPAALSLSLLALLIFIVVLLRREGRGAAKTIIVDGSNVIHWKDNRPAFGPLQQVISRLQSESFQVHVVFDANAGYLLRGRYQDANAFANQLGLPRRQVHVVGKGEVADALILKLARKRRAKVVSNDRYRDWAARYPEVESRDWRLYGGYQDGKLWLRVALPPSANSRAA